MSLATESNIQTHTFGLAPGPIEADEQIDVQSEEMLVNMGPQHPSTHGVLRLVLRTDGEVVLDAVPLDRLDARIEALLGRVASMPKNQLMMQKLMINQALDNMGLRTTQLIANLFDGISRHTPEGVAFKARCEAVGFNEAVRERDSGMPHG